MGRKLAVLRALITGITLEYLFDPQMGRTRRTRLADQLKARARRLGREADKKVRYQKGRLRGVVHEFSTTDQTPVSF
jgi:hypothetical protein